MSEEKWDLISVGEKHGPPWTSMSQASMAKVMNAILRTGAELTGSYVQNVEYAPRTSVYYSVRVRSDRLEEFKKLVEYPIAYHPNIQVGMDTMKSVKQIIYEVPA